MLNLPHTTRNSMGNPSFQARAECAASTFEQVRAKNNAQNVFLYNNSNTANCYTSPPVVILW